MQTQTTISLALLTGVLILFGIACTQLARIILVDNGHTAYLIVIPAQATAAERKAANELQRYLREMSGASLPIVTDADSAQSAEIIIGKSARLSDSGVDTDFTALEQAKRYGAGERGMADHLALLNTDGANGPRRTTTATGSASRARTCRRPSTWSRPRRFAISRWASCRPSVRGCSCQ